MLKCNSLRKAHGGKGGKGMKAKRTESLMFKITDWLVMAGLIKSDGVVAEILLTIDALIRPRDGG